jgi:hypothetical protein
MTRRFLFTCLYCATCILYSQDFSFKLLDIEKSKGFVYVGGDSMSQVYVSKDLDIYYLNKGDMNQYKKVGIKTRNNRETFYSACMMKGYIYLVTTNSFWYAPDSAIPYNKTIYQIQPGADKSTRVVKFGSDDRVDVLYKVYTDTFSESFTIFRNDSLQTILGLDLQEKTTNMQHKRFVEADYLGNRLKIRNLGGQPPVQTYLTVWKISKKTWLDTLSSRNYSISHTRITDEKVFFFEEYITDILVASEGGTGKKASGLMLDSGKIIIDLAYKVDAEGNLVLFGKYRNSEKNHLLYGMFSCKYDKVVGELGPVNYYHLLEMDINSRDTFNKRYFGLVFNYLALPDYSFFIPGNNTYVMSYQADFSYFLDHIYILKIGGNGELEFNTIGYQYRKSIYKKTSDQHYIAFCRKDTLCFLFYDHQKNLDYPGDQMDVNVCTMESYYRTASIMSCKYDINRNILGRKKIIQELTPYLLPPNLHPFLHYTDPITDRVFIYIEGPHRLSRRDKVLYELAWLNN